MAKSEFPKHDLHAAIMEARAIWCKDFHLTGARFLGALRKWFDDTKSPNRLGESSLSQVLSGQKQQPQGNFKHAIRAAAAVLQNELDRESKEAPHFVATTFKGDAPNFYEHLNRIGFLGDYSQARHVPRPMRSGTATEAQKAQIEQRMSAIARFTRQLPACDPIDREGLQRIRVHLMGKGDDAKPLIFYHWRQRHDHLHWVDFLFLRLLREFSLNGFEPHALVTEWERPLPDAVRLAVRRLLGEDKLTTVNQAQAHHDDYMKYAREHASGADIEEILAQRDESARTWIPYIPYRVNALKRPGYVQLVWHRNKPKWEYGHVFNDPSVERIQLFTRDIKIGEVRAKAEEPPLLVEPVPCPSVGHWLFPPEQPRHHDEVKTFVTHIAALEQAVVPIDTNTMARSEFQAQWLGRLTQDAHPELPGYVGHLAYLLEHWDREYLS